VSAHAQAIPTASSDATSTITNGAGPAGIIPATHGFNASLGTTAQHDSSNGWSSLLTPGIAYRFSRFFSLNASVPIYSSINVETNTGAKANPVYTSTTKHGALGDAALSALIQTHPNPFDYSAAFSIGLPSGNSAYGLGAGQTTYDLNNHIEKSFGIFTPNIEAGIANSNSLITTRVHKSYTTVGTLAHFQVGTSVDLPFNMSFEADAYEQLPLVASTIYSTTARGRKKATTATTGGSAEDNGLITSLDIPLNGHVTLSSFYNRSIRSRDDIAGFSLTFLLVPSPRTIGVTK
jgi:hypothetical protein